MMKKQSDRIQYSNYKLIEYINDLCDLYHNYHWNNVRNNETSDK